MTIPKIDENANLRSQFERNRDEARRLMLEGNDQFLRDLGQRQFRFWSNWIERVI